jgi:hypothetical protein
VTDRGGWARGGLVVVALGVASNLVLTFVPDVVPDQAAQVILYCMTAVIVVVTPLWVYREEEFVARAERAHASLVKLAEHHDGRAGKGALRVHTYRSWVQHSATIADPWSEEPKGYIEFHVFRRRRSWVRLVASGFEEAARGNQPYVSHILREADRLLGYRLIEVGR